MHDCTNYGKRGQLRREWDIGLRIGFTAVIKKRLCILGRIKVNYFQNCAAKVSTTIYNDASIKKKYEVNQEIWQKVYVPQKLHDIFLQVKKNEKQ